MNSAKRASLYQQTIREIAIKSLGGKCSKCGSTDNLQIHHKDNNLRNLKMSNLTLFCTPCHSIFHGKNIAFRRRGNGLQRVRSTVYVQNNLWNDFNDICLREGESMSQKVEGFISRYVMAHKHGNPQTLLERYGGEAKQKCYGCKKWFSGLPKVLFLSGEKGFVCSSCKQDYQNRGLIRKVLKV